MCTVKPLPQRSKLMPFVIHSPFDGQPVKIRDKDIGRAIRDKENRIFYVLPNSTGDGYYSSPTRQGGLKDEQKYQRMMEKTAQTARNVREEAAETLDATGGKRKKGKGKLVLLVLVVIVVIVAYYVWKNHGDKLPDIDIAPPSGRAPGTPILVV